MRRTTLKEASTHEGRTYLKICQGSLHRAAVGLFLAILLPATAQGKDLPGCDFNGDGYQDLAIGVPGESEGALPNGAGGVNVLYGTEEGLWATGNQLWTQNTPGILGVAELGDGFGSALACGDFNADGWDDLAMGCPGEGLIPHQPWWGAINVFYGCDQGRAPSGTSSSTRTPSESRGSLRLLPDDRGLRRRRGLGSGDRSQAR